MRYSKNSSPGHETRFTIQLLLRLLLAVAAAGSLIIPVIFSGIRIFHTLHTIIDTSLVIISGIISMLLWKLGSRSNLEIFKGLSVSFGLSSFLKLIYLSSNSIIYDFHIPILQFQYLFWSSSVYILPIGILYSLMQKKSIRKNRFRFFLQLFLISVLLSPMPYILFRKTGFFSYEDNNLFLFFVPLLWGFIAVKQWNPPEKIQGLCSVSAIISLFSILILFTAHNDDGLALIYHTGKLTGYTVFLIIIIKIAGNEILSSITNEEKLSVLNRELEKIVKARTIQLEKAVQSLKSSEERYSLVESATEEGIWDWNMVTHEEYFSPRWKEILGYRDEELLNIDSTFFDLVHPDDINQINDALKRHVENNESFREEIRMKHQSGSYIWILIRGSVIRNEGNPARMLGSIIDITAIKNNETALVQSEILLRELSENLPELLWIRDMAGTLIYANSNWETFLNRQPHLGAPFSTLFSALHPEDIPIARQRSQEFPEGGFNEMLRFITKEGEIRWIQVNTFPVKDVSGKTYRIVGLGKDLTDFKLARDALEESREVFKQFLAKSPLANYIKDENFKIIYVNPLAEEMGRQINPDAKLLGNTMYDILPKEVADKIHAEEIEIIRKNKTLVSQDRVPAPSGVKYYHAVRFPISLPDGRKFIGGQRLDITDTVNLEEDLKASRIMLEEAQQLSHVGSWELDLKTNNLHWSNEIFSIFEIDPEKFDASYEAFLNAIHPEDRDEVNRAFTESIEKKIPYEITHRLLMKDGRIKYVQERGKTFYDDNEIALRSIGTVQDITDRQLAEIKIQNSLTEKEILLKEIHHRVKNNLQIISSLLYLQASNLKPDLQNLFRESQNRISSMALIHEKLYRSEDLSNISFREYVTELTGTLLQSFGISAKGIEISTETDEISLDIGTAIPCGLIINELVSNAFKHAFPEKKGKIQISLSEDNNYYRLTVSDNGIGLPGDIENRKESSLGVKLVEHLSEQLEGTYKYTSSESGTIFNLTFPKKQSESLQTDKYRREDHI